MESDSTQSWLILSRASGVQELAQKVPRPVASHRKGPGLRHRLSPWLVFTLGFTVSLCFWQSFREPSAGPAFRPAVPPASRPPCSARVKMTKARLLSEGLGLGREMREQGILGAVTAALCMCRVLNGSRPNKNLGWGHCKVLVFMTTWR